MFCAQHGLVIENKKTWSFVFSILVIYPQWGQSVFYSYFLVYVAGNISIKTQLNNHRVTRAVVGRSKKQFFNRRRK